MLQKDLKALAKRAASIKVQKIPAPKRSKNDPYVVPEFRSRPTLHLSEDNLPAIKDWEVGGEYTIAMRVKQTGSEQKEWTNNKVMASFEVLEIAHLPNPGKGKEKY